MPPDHELPDDLEAFPPDDEGATEEFDEDGGYVSPFLEDDLLFLDEHEERAEPLHEVGEGLRGDHGDHGASFHGKIEEFLDEAGGSFAVAGVLDMPPPTVRVRGSDVAWPLDEGARGRLLEACCRSWFGGDELTSFDPAVRSCWELSPEQLEVEGLAPVVEAALREMERALGEGPLQAELYKLLHYEPGDHFKAHRDGARDPDMVGTLVIGLPGEHQGGELRVSLCGDELRSRLTSTAGRTGFVGFYADCVHELRPVEEGYRSCLSLIVRRTQAPDSSFPRYAPIGLVEAVEAWMNDPEQPRVLALPLLHRYPQRPPMLSELRGRDREAVEALLAAARVAGCEGSLASIRVRAEIEDRPRWSFDLFEGEERPENISTWALLRGWALAFLDPSFGGRFTGNESEYHYLSYQGAALVLRRPPLAGDAGWMDDDPRFERRALSSLLARARRRRWRCLDLGWLFEPELLPSQVHLLTELAPHLEELRCRAGRWTAWLGPFKALTRLEIDGRERLNGGPMLPGDLPAALAARLRSFTLINDRQRLGATEQTEMRDAIEALDDAAQLRELDLRNCLLLALPPGLSRAPLRSLRVVEASSQFELPPWLGADGCLEELYIEDARGNLEIPPQALGGRLRVLDLRTAGVRQLDLRGASGLRRLTLGPGPLASAPAGLEGLERLEWLSINFPGARRSSVWDLPSLAGLRSLRSLEVHLTPPAKIPALPASGLLERLVLGGNGLTGLPPELPSLTRLRTLDAEGNRLASLPDLSPLRRLLSLRLAKNPLASIEGLSSLVELEELDLKYCEDLVFSCDRLPRLRHLWLAGTRCAAVPSWVLRLPELRRLSLEVDRETVAALSSGELPALRWLEPCAVEVERLPFPRLDWLPRGCVVIVSGGDWQGDLAEITRRLEKHGVGLTGWQDF